jgi:hypothetical protein
LKTIQATSDLLGLFFERGSNNITQGSIQLSLFYIRKATLILQNLDSIPKIFPDSKVCFLFENLIFLFGLVERIDFNNHDFRSILYNPAIEAGFEFCSYCSLPRLKNHNSVIMVSRRYTKALCKLMKPILNASTITKVNTILGPEE